MVLFWSMIGCALSEPAFVEKMAESECGMLVACVGEDALSLVHASSVEQCVENSMINTGGEFCADDGFDGVAAQRCIEALEARSCDDYLAGTPLDACADVCPAAVVSK